MERKSPRLPNYDYSQAGLYFLTLCTKGKAPLFGRVCVGGGALDAPKVELSQYGAVIERWLADCAGKYEDLAILKHVVMPNHVHVIVELRGGPSRAPAPTQSRANERIPGFVSGMKRLTNRCCGVALWQRGYYDHVIRNDADFLRVWNYIDTNPAKWAEDEYFVR